MQTIFSAGEPQWGDEPAHPLPITMTFERVGVVAVNYAEGAPFDLFSATGAPAAAVWNADESVSPPSFSSDVEFNAKYLADWIGTWHVDMWATYLGPYASNTPGVLFAAAFDFTVYVVCTGTACACKFKFGGPPSGSRWASMVALASKTRT